MVGEARGEADAAGVELTRFCARRDRRAILPRMTSRRYFLLLGSAALVAYPRSTFATGMSRITAYAFSFKGIDGGEIRLASHAGQPLLVVNTASQCGYTPQYAGLQTLWSRYQARGLVVLAVPSNDFGGQEPGGARDIHATAQGQYHVTFPIADKVAVKGKDAHPFYKWAAAEAPLEGPRWNCPKALGASGRVPRSVGTY